MDFCPTCLLSLYMDGRAHAGFVSCSTCLFFFGGGGDLSCCACNICDIKQDPHRDPDENKGVKIMDGWMDKIWISFSIFNKSTD